MKVSEYIKQFRDYKTPVISSKTNKPIKLSGIAISSKVKFVPL